MQVVRHVLVVAVDDEAAGARRRVAPSLQLEVAVVVGAAADAGVRELHGVLRAHGEEHHGVGRDTKPECKI